MRRSPKRNADDAMAAMVTRPIATTGEVFADGTTIELIGGAQDGNQALMLWDGAKEIIGAHVERNERIYAPVQINISVLKELTLPTQGRPYGTTRKIFAEICKLFEDFAGLQENSASLVGRFVLSTWVVEAVPVAPALVLIGPDTMRGNRLVALLHCLCRHGLRMTGLSPTGLRSLPSGVGFTMLISQPTIGGKLERMLDDASRRDQKIPYRGGLLDLFGALEDPADPNHTLFAIHKRGRIRMAPRIRPSAFGVRPLHLGG